MIVKFKDFLNESVKIGDDIAEGLPDFDYAELEELRHAIKKCDSAEAEAAWTVGGFTRYSGYTGFITLENKTLYYNINSFYNATTRKEANNDSDWLDTERDLMQYRKSAEHALSSLNLDGLKFAVKIGSLDPKKVSSDSKKMLTTHFYTLLDTRSKAHYSERVSLWDKVKKSLKF